MYLVVLYIFIRWKGRVTIIVTITFLRIIARTVKKPAEDGKSSVFVLLR